MYLVNPVNLVNLVPTFSRKPNYLMVTLCF